MDLKDTNEEFSDNELADTIRDLNGEMIALIEEAVKRDIVVEYNVLETHNVGCKSVFTYELKITKIIQEEL